MVSLLFIVNNSYNIMIKLYMYYNKSKISVIFLCLTNTNYFSKPLSILHNNSSLTIYKNLSETKLLSF